MMKAIQFQGKPLGDPQAAIEIELPAPVPSGRDVLVRVEAVAVNPVDAKVRPGPDKAPAILGYDAAGTVVAVGEACVDAKVGDAVYYAGDIRRSGTNCELHLVDERIIAIRPRSLSAAEAASLPLTSLTAWEALFDRLRIDRCGADKGKSILIIGAAGGVGSMAIQLAKMAGLRVIGTASREESAAWCRELGADYIVDHRENLRPQVEQLGLEYVDFIANFHNTDAYWGAMGDLIAPQGGIVLIVEPSGALPLGDPLKRKSVTIAWEFMFTRALFTTADIARQRTILSEVAALVDQGVVRHTMARDGGPLTPANLIAAHRMIESGATIGKIVLAVR